MTAPKFSQLRFYLFVFRIVDIDIYEIFDLLDGVLNLLDSRARDVGVQWFVETIVKLPGLRQACHARPNGPLSPNDNRAIRLLLELLEVMTSRAKYQTHKIDVGKFLVKNVFVINIRQKGFTTFHQIFLKASTREKYCYFKTRFSFFVQV